MSCILAFSFTQPGHQTMTLKDYVGIIKVRFCSTKWYVICVSHVTVSLLGRYGVFQDGGQDNKNQSFWNFNTKNKFTIKYVSKTAKMEIIATT